MAVNQGQEDKGKKQIIKTNRINKRNDFFDFIQVTSNSMLT